MVFATVTSLFLLAQQPAPAAPACATTDTALPGGLAAWTSPGASLTVGAAARLPAGVIVPVLTSPSRPGLSATRAFTIAEAGTYAIALDQGGWIDVLSLDAHGRPSGAPLPSVGHGHGPACSTIRKIVRFTLAPGAYALQLSGLSRPDTRVMLVAAAALPQELAK